MIGTEDVWIPTIEGINQRVDPEDLPPGQVADARNVEWSRPYASVGPRAGSRSLAAYDALPLGGHPGSPVGNALFDGSAEILALVTDERNRRLWVIYRAGTDGDGDPLARAAYANLNAASPGVDTAAASPTFKIDASRIPGTQILDGRLFIATGSRYASRNVVVDPVGMTLLSALPDPIQPPTPTVAAVSPAGGETGISAVTGWTYRAVPINSRSRGMSKPSDSSASTGAQTLKKIKVTVGGVDPVSLYDKIRLYRTTDGGATWRFVGEQANPGKNQNRDFFDFTTDDRLSYEEIPLRWGRPPSCRYLIAHNDRLLWGCKTDYPVDFSIVYYSEVNAPFNVDPVFNAVAVGRNDGGAIVGLFRLVNRVYVIKSNGSIWELADNRPETVYRADPLINEGPWACVSAATILEINGAAYWLAAGGWVRFTGESIGFVSTAVEPILTSLALTQSQSLQSVPESGPATLIASDLTYTNTDAVPETIGFEFRYTTSAVSESTGLVLTLTTALNAANFYGNGSSFPSAGLSMQPNQQISLRVIPPSNSLTVGTTYYRWVRAVDSAGGATSWQALGGQVMAYSQLAGGEDAAWGQACKFFAVDFWPLQEVWIFGRSPASTIIDTRIVLAYESLESESGPSWRRDFVHTTAAVVVPNMNLGAGHTNDTVAILADALGCLWVTPWAGNIDHVVTASSALNDGQRHGAGAISYGGGAWTLAADGSAPWPVPGGIDPGLKGQRVVLRDAMGAVYTAIITTNTETTATLSFWTEGRTPTSGAAVQYAVGGIDAAVEWYPQALEEPHLEKEVRELLLSGSGGEAIVEVELRAGDQCEIPTAAALVKMRRRSLSVALGARQKRKPVVLRGKWIGLKLGSFRAGAVWRLQAWGLAVLRSGAKD